jgi:pimeloyl-ACP methyl ester carboxylesterase/DNA-binding CsgD family transcriptional regulator
VASAQEASAATYQLLNDDRAMQGVRWVQCDRDGHLIIGGITALDGSIRLVSAADVDRSFAVLVDWLATAARPGSISLSPDGEELHWATVVVSTAKMRRGFSIPYASFAANSNRLNADCRLTPAEKRLFFQIAGGQSLRDAALRDGVAVETKRAQCKALLAKLDCSTQGDVARLALGQLSHMVETVPDDDGGLHVVERFTAQYVSAHARLVLQRLPSGRLLRLYQAGPPSGRLVVLLHGMLLPLPLIDAEPHLAAAGLRIMMPIRSGYLDDHPVSALRHDGDVVDRDISMIAEWLALRGEPQTPVVGISYGAAPAISLACRHPALVSHLILLSMNAGGLHDARDDYSFRFYSALGRVSNQPGIARLLAWQFKRYYADPKTVTPVLKRLFGGSAADLAVLNDNRRASPYQWFSDSYRSSIVGIAEDFRFIMGNWRAQLSAVRCPVNFIHGRDDALIRSHLIESVADAINAPVDLIEGGHLAVAGEAAAAWRAVAAALAPC